MARIPTWLITVRGPPRAAAFARVAAGLVFVVVGLGKYVAHADEAAAFRTYGLPYASAFVYAVGAVELIGGLMLVAGLGLRIAAPFLAGNMVGAIATAGRAEGGPVHLGLAPALLVTLLGLLWTGAGRWSLDARLARRHIQPS